MIDRPGRTGAHRPAASAPAPPPTRLTATYRGIRWRKDPDGTIGWYNEGVGWRRWRPGADAPPLPPRWEADAARVPVPPRLRRAPWRSPYRLVPIALAVAAIVVGVVQATRTTDHAAATANREAHALVGKCLEATKARPPTYSTTPVPCASAKARVEVVAVHEARGKQSGCSPSTTALQLSYAGVRTPDVECVRPVHHGRKG